MGITHVFLNCLSKSMLLVSIPTPGNESPRKEGLAMSTVDDGLWPKSPADCGLQIGAVIELNYSLVAELRSYRVLGTDDDVVEATVTDECCSGIVFQVCPGGRNLVMEWDAAEIDSIVRQGNGRLLEPPVPAASAATRIPVADLQLVGV
jgi:hypothetical protein